MPDGRYDHDRRRADTTVYDQTMPARQAGKMSDELAREHVETLLAAAHELADVCILIARQLRPAVRAALPHPYRLGQDRSPASQAADLLEQTADSTGETRRLLRAVLRVLSAGPASGPVLRAAPEPEAGPPGQAALPAPAPALDKPPPAVLTVPIPPPPVLAGPVPAEHPSPTEEDELPSEPHDDALLVKPWNPPYGGSTPSSGGSASAYLADRHGGRHALDETGAWRLSDVAGPAGGRHATADQPAADHPAAEGPTMVPAAPADPVEVIDPAALAVAVRQVEASRRHLQAALLSLRDALRDGDGSLLALVEHSLAVVAESADYLRDALEPEHAQATLPGEARFCCAVPWQQVALVPAEVALAAATVPGVTQLLTALGYDARLGYMADDQPQVVLTGPRFQVRVVPQQLRLAGSGEWQAYLDWIDQNGERYSEAETLGPAELADDEVARRVDDALRRRLS